MRINQATREEAQRSPSFVAILDHRGVLVDVDADADEAYLRAKHASPTGTVIVDGTVFADHSSEPIHNPVSRDAAERALDASKIEPIDADWSDFRPLDRESDKKIADAAREVLRVRAKEIYESLIEQSEELIHVTQKRGGVAAQFKNSWLTDHMLRQNQKMKKVLGLGEDYDSIGLSLLPHGASFREPFSTSTDQGPHGATNCLFSTKECRKVCLVNTGQRALESGAFAASYLFSQLARELPREFSINLFDRTCKAFEKAEREGFRRFIRLNVLSDLPWEHLAPGLLEGICDYARRRSLGRRKWKPTNGLAFYDYTKIPYRRGIDDYYDLTFSFSGVRGMFDAFFDVVEGDDESAPRCAVVFVQREHRPIRKTEAYYRAAPGKPLLAKGEKYKPWEFYGQRVWNGDETDIRPLDPDDVKIVGLAYKVARYKVAPPAGSKKKFGLENVVESSELDRELPTFLVRVRQPDPDAPPIVTGTQDPENRRLVLPVWNR